MMLLSMLTQVATEAAKSSSYVTGQFVLDGALLIGALKAVEVIVSKVRTKRNGGVKPGEGKKCQEHGEAIAGLVKSEENTGDALKRIEGKVDQLILTMVGK